MGDQTSGGNFAVVFNKMTPYILMVCMQFGSAGNYILSMISLNSGMNRYVLIVYRNGVAALVLAPFALLLERSLDTNHIYIVAICTQVQFLNGLKSIPCGGY